MFLLIIITNECDKKFIANIFEIIFITVLKKNKQPLNKLNLDKNNITI